MTQAVLDRRREHAVPRSLGSAELTTKRSGVVSAIDKLRSAGATKLLFPSRRGPVEAIVVNTAGGLTGGDTYRLASHAGAASHLILTTQAAERAYRSAAGQAQVETTISAGPGARLHWLPQEMIIFDGAALHRSLSVDLAAGAEAVLVEPLVFGRTAMGEVLHDGTLDDQITVARDGVPIYRDRIRLGDALGASLARPSVAGGMAALATVICAGPRAEALLDLVRQLLPATGSASLLARDFMVLRLLAGDGYLLRRTLVPVLETLTGAALPKSWSL
ncbi:MAG: urease accessory protein UreD [Pseudomonadota bacterium]